MELNDIKQKIEAVEDGLPHAPFVIFDRVTRNERTLTVALTERLRRLARKGGVWKAKGFLTAVKNIYYGLDDRRLMSRGGRDGIFLLGRTFQPKNDMMRKIFDRYLDKKGSGAEAVAKTLGASVHDLIGVRVVSHHLRLLGVLHRAEKEDWLVLVDYDRQK